MTGRQPGALLRHEQVGTGITGARAWRIHYISRDVNNVEHEVSGLVIAPAGDGVNRPIFSWCHGTTGLGDAACPSAQPDPARELVTYFTPEATQQIDYGVPGLQGFIDAGWVVCATDYQGLGTEGIHQYTVNITNARDAVNIAHAARQLDVGAGTQLGCAGWSQGGGAAAAAAELDDDDYRELRLIGTVPMSPAWNEADPPRETGQDPPSPDPHQGTGPAALEPRHRRSDHRNHPRVVHRDTCRTPQRSPRRVGRQHRQHRHDSCCGTPSAGRLSFQPARTRRRSVSFRHTHVNGTSRPVATYSTVVG